MALINVFLISWKRHKTEMFYAFDNVARNIEDIAKYNLFSNIITQPLKIIMKLSSFKLRFRNNSLRNHQTSQLYDETSKFEIEISEQFNADHATFQLTVFSCPKNWHVSSVISSSFTQPRMVWNPSKSNSITSYYFRLHITNNYHQ